MRMTTFSLPDLGEGLQEAEIVAWHVAEGDAVKTDDLLVSVETAKAVVEVPSPYTGVIEKLYASAGDIVATGAPLVDFSEESSADAAPQTVTAESGEVAATVVGNVRVASGNSRCRRQPAAKERKNKGDTVRPHAGEADGYRSRRYKPHRQERTDHYRGPRKLRSER
jgi:pyruvate dehydrogenase E2 component (dihydrolipoamide acetyltransferase)